jgi:5'(3')-deoxyribonucleotidase
MHTIGIDMDGTIADFIGGFVRAANNKYGSPGNNIKRTDITEYNLKTVLNKKFPISKEEKNLLENLIQPEFFTYLDIFPEVVETLKQLNKKNKIIIISRAINFYNCTSEKTRWLKHHLKDINYDIIYVDSSSNKTLINVDYMVDDDPKVISKLTTQTGIMTEQPWNLKYRQENRVISVDNFSKVKEYISNYE